jgi:hypothetical protein
VLPCQRNAWVEIAIESGSTLKLLFEDADAIRESPAESREWLRV